MRGPPLKRERGTAWWVYVLGYGAIAPLFYIADVMNKSSAGTGTSLLLGVFGLGALGIFLNIIWGASAKETGTNLLTVIKWVCVICVASFVLVGLGRFTGCDGDVPSLPENIRR